MTNFTHGFQYPPKQKQKQKPDPMDMVIDFPFRIRFKWIGLGVRKLCSVIAHVNGPTLTSYLKKVTN